MNTIEHLKGITNNYREKIFLIDAASERSFTFGDVDLTAKSIARDLFQRNIKKGDRVAILLENRIETALLYFGCLYAGIVTVPVNAAFSKKDIIFILEHSGAKCVFVSEKTYPIIDEYYHGGPTCGVIMLKSEQSKQALHNLDIWDIDNLPSPENIQSFDHIHAEDTLTIVYTSGTTSQPKGIVHSIDNIILDSLMLNDRLGVTPHNRFLCILPLTYIGGYQDSLLLPYAAGASVVLSEAFNVKSAFNFWDPVIRHEINSLCLVPSIVAILMKVDRGSIGATYCARNIRLAMIGTAPLPPSLRISFEQRYGIKLYENYGLSEAIILTTNDPNHKIVEGSVGRPLDNVDLAIFDEKKEKLPCGMLGEIAIKSPCLMKGYYNPLTQEPDPVAPGYFFTGDIGLKTEDGNVFIKGRKKDMIIRGGVNVSPVAIEDIINRHPYVNEGVIIGAPHPILGEEIVAVVQLKDNCGNEKETLNSIKHDCNRSLGKMNKIAQILSIDDIPIGSNGKVLKNMVREYALRLLGHLKEP